MNVELRDAQNPGNVLHVFQDFPDAPRVGDRIMWGPPPNTQGTVHWVLWDTQRGVLVLYMVK